MFLSTTLLAENLEDTQLAYGSTTYQIAMTKRWVRRASNISCSATKKLLLKCPILRLFDVIF